MINRLGTQITIIISTVLAASLLVGILLAHASEKSRLERVIKDRTQRILLSLQASHTQAMIHRGNKKDNNPVINALNDSLKQLSLSQKNATLWLYMGPKVIAYQKAQGSDEIEPPQDQMDKKSLASKQHEFGFIANNHYRYSIPVILGEGNAANKKCFSCHAKDMNMSEGDLLGGFSISYNAQNDMDDFNFTFFKAFTFIAAMVLFNGIILVTVIRYLVSSPISSAVQILQDITKDKDISKVTSKKIHSQEINQIFQSAKKLSLYANKRSQDILTVVNKHSIVAITDIKGTITHANDKFCDISGYSKEELIGSNHRQLKSGRHDTEFFAEIFRTITKGKTWQGEICNYSKSGREYWVDTTISPILKSNGKIKYYIAIRTDITPIKSAEESLILAKRSAEETAKIKSEFLANMSHEIRTPMNGVLGMLNVLKSTELNDNQQKKLAMAHDSAQSLLYVINEVLDFSKVESGNLELESVDFNLKVLIGDIADSYGLRLEEKNLELIIDSTGIDNPMVTGDPGRIRQIINNLLGNAFKFTSDGEIIITAKLVNETDDTEQLRLICSVRDTGVGIPPNVLPKLFTPFTQADSSTTRKFGGTGLGLSITKKLCNVMGGSIEAHSQPGEGSTFEFNIQLIASHQTLATLPNLGIEDTRILIVDDNQTNLEVLSNQLEHWGALVTLANGGDEALKYLNTHEFDLAILDMQMPGMDGAKLGELIRSNTLFDDIKLVMMTSMSHRGDAAHFAKLGFQAYIPKPVTTDDLYKAISVLQETPQDLASPPFITTHYLHELQVKSPTIPPHCRILLVDDVPINLEVVKCLLEDSEAIIDAAYNGLEALEALKAMDQKSPYQIILMDCQMPEMDGYQAATAIRNGDAGIANIEIPIVAMTANALSHDKQKCLDSGMNDYISKPIDPSILYEKISTWVNK